MYNKKVAMAVAGIAALLVLFAGVGYAAFAGEAKTYNEGNNAKLEFIKATPADFGVAIDANSQTLFDSYTFSTGTAYKFRTATEGDPVATYTAVQLGTKTIAVNNNSGADITAISVKIDSVKNGALSTIGNADFVYIFKIQQGGNTAQYTVFNGVNTKTIDSVACPTIANGGSADFTLTLYIGCLTADYVPTIGVGNAITGTAYADLSVEEKAKYTGGYHISANAPASLVGIDFAFLIKDATTA